MKFKCIEGKFNLEGLSSSQMAMIEVSLRNGLKERKKSGESEEYIEAIEEILKALDQGAELEDDD